MQKVIALNLTYSDMINSYIIFFTTDISKSHARRTSVWEMLFFHVCDDVIVLQAKYRWTILLEDPRADTT